MLPDSAYNQSGKNTFLILNSSESNGLRALDPGAAIPIYGLVITNPWIKTVSMPEARTQFAYIRAQTGKILAAGGITTNGQVSATADEYDPVQLTWTQTASNLSVARQLNSVCPCL